VAGVCIQRFVTAACELNLDVVTTRHFLADYTNCNVNCGGAVSMVVRYEACCHTSRTQDRATSLDICTRYYARFGLRIYVIN
jgi:hypothetical protein